MIDVTPPRNQGESLQNVIVGAFGLTGAIVLGAIVSGLALSGVWIAWRRWHRTYDTDAPPSLGPIPIDPSSTSGSSHPPSSQDQ